MLRSANPALLAIAIALCAGGSYLLISSSHRSQAEPEATGCLLVATQRILPQSVLKDNQFAVERRPVQYIPSDALSNPQDALGRRARIEILPGDLLLESKLLKRGDTSLASLPVPPGKRAVTVGVDEVVGVAGFLQPGSYVDVLASWQAGDGEYLSKVILQRISVLAIAQEATPEEANKAKPTSSVTLAVSPSEAEKLILASDRGKIRLAMRAPQETNTSKTSGINTRSLGGELAPKAPKAALEKVKYAHSVLPTPPKAEAPQVAPVAHESHEDAILVIRGTQTNQVRGVGL